jgi:cysteine desulfurase / selenocysteine lyase
MPYMPQHISDQVRAEFPFFTNNPGITYLDSAATSIKLGVVGEIHQDYIDNSGMTIARSTSRLSNDLYLRIEEVRAVMLEFFTQEGRGGNKQIYFTSGATDSANQIAVMLEENIVWQQGDKIIIAIDNHHANILPYYRMIDNLGALEVDIEWLYLDNETKEIDYTKFSQTCSAKDSNKIKAIVLCQSSNVLGNSINWNFLDIALEPVKNSAITILDATQSFVHGFKIPEIVDFCFGSAHKMYGSQGLGFTFFSRKFLSWLPAKLGGGIVLDVGQEGVVFYEDGIQFEAGTLNFPAILSLPNCIEFIKAHKWPVLDFSGFTSLEKGFKIVSSMKIKEENQDTKMVTLECLNSSPLDVAIYLETLGIVSRAGMHCAQPLHQYLGLKQGTIRFSFAHYTNQQDIDKLVISLAKSA